MPKNKKRKKNSTAAAPQKGIRSMVPICVRAVLISYLVFMVCAALLAWFVLRKESAPTKTVQMAFLMAITAFSFLLCGFLSARICAFNSAHINPFTGCKRRGQCFNLCADWYRDTLSDIGRYYRKKSVKAVMF